MAGTATLPATQAPELIVEAKRPMARLLAYLKPFRGRLAFSISSSVANKVLDLMPPLLVAWVIDSVTGTPPEWIQGVISSGDPWHMAQLLAALVVIIFGLESLFQWMFQYGFMTLAQKVQHALRCDAYDQIQGREIAFFEEHRLGETMAMLNDDVNQLERFLNTGFNELVQLATLFLFAGWVLMDRSWELALYGMCPIPVIIGGSLIYQKVIAPRYSRVRESVGALASRLENNLGGILVIKSFTAEKFESERVADASSEYQVANYHAIKLAAIYVPLIRMGIALGFAAVLLVGAYWVLNKTTTVVDGVEVQKITAGGLVMFSMMIQRLLWPLTRLGSTLDEYERAKASARRTFGLLDTPSTIKDPVDAESLGERAEGHVVFDNVEFSYSRGERVLKGLTFEAKPGETIGIAGPTGAGKSTLIKLLLRLYDVTGGGVKVDGHFVDKLKLAELRHNIALVSQDVYLFHGTIRDNIAYGMGDVSLEKVEDAAKLAQLHRFVETLPDGYETVVGERGIKLSGGQRQRLSIARAILKDAPILVLDEATSSVDTETEREIQQNLRKLTAGRTALIIAHRLSTIRHADRIIVLKDGRVSEEGTHDALIASGGVYSDLWHVQSGDVESSGKASELNT